MRLTCEFAILPRTHWPILGRSIVVGARTHAEAIEGAIEWTRRAENRHHIPEGTLQLHEVRQHNVT